MRVLVTEEVYERLLPYSHLLNSNIRVYEVELLTPFVTVITSQPFNEAYDEPFNVIYLTDYIGNHDYQGRYYPKNDLELTAFIVALASCNENYLLEANKPNRIYFHIPEVSLERYHNRYLHTLNDLMVRVKKELKDENNLVENNYHYQAETKSLLVDEPKPMQLSNGLIRVFEKDEESYLSIKQEGINYRDRCEAMKRDTQYEVYQNVQELRAQMKYFQTPKVNSFMIQNLQEDVKNYEMQMVENTPQYDYFVKDIIEDLEKIVEKLKQRLTFLQYIGYLLIPFILFGINFIFAILKHDLLDYLVLSILTISIPVVTSIIYYVIQYKGIKKLIHDFNGNILNNFQHYHLSDQISCYFTAIYNATKINAIIDHSLDTHKVDELEDRMNALQEEINQIKKLYPYQDVPPFKIVGNHIVMDDEKYTVANNSLKTFTTFIENTSMEVAAC